MWTSLLLLCSQLLFAVVIASDTFVWSKCPTNCSCIGDVAATYFEIDCQEHSHIDGEQLSQNLDSFLTSNLTYSRLASLTIIRVGLKHVPQYICRFTSLTRLILDNNRLTGLPDGCLSNLTNLVLFSAAGNKIETLPDGVFDGLKNLRYLYLNWNKISFIPSSMCQLTMLTSVEIHENRLKALPDNCLTNLKNLEWFSAYDNQITALQNGVFDGLHKLFYLDLSRNRISSIGLSVFATSSDLPRLFYIYLSRNNLTSLEPWIFDRGLIGNYEKRVSIYLDKNAISTFTNKMNHRGLCHNEILFVNVYLRYNNMRHFVDILNGWQLDIKQLFQCYSSKPYDGPVNLLIKTDGSDIPCDCINYHFYREVARHRLGHAWGTTTCTFTDPQTGNSSIMNGYDMDPSLFVCEVTERCPARCICVHRPADATLHVYCSNTNLTVLPLELPELPDNGTKYKLDFSNNQLLCHLEHRDYFANTSFLDVGNCGIDDIRDWDKIAKIQDINLSGNKLASLPPAFASVNVSGKLNLGSNPWNCSCDNKWMSKWLNDIADRLTENVRCNSPYRLRGKNIIQISDKEFCVDPASEAFKTALIITLSSLASVLVILVSIGVVVYRLRVKLYTKWNFHLFDRDECLGEDMDYDVFLCCSSADTDPHGQRILELIESKGYSVCYHERDFLPGQLILENINHSIVRSKRTVCLLSENFLLRYSAK